MKHVARGCRRSCPILKCNTGIITSLHPVSVKAMISMHRLEIFLLLPSLVAHNKVEFVFVCFISRFSYHSRCILRLFLFLLCTPTSHERKTV